MGRSNETLIRKLACPLTEAEWDGASRQLASAVDELRKLESEKTSASSTFGTRIKDQKKQIADLSEQVRSREMLRDVQCYERPDLTRGVIELVRKDTHEIVGVPREMDDVERAKYAQGAFDFDGKKGTGDGGKAKRDAAPQTNGKRREGATGAGDKISTVGDVAEHNAGKKNGKKSGAQRRKEIKERSELLRSLIAQVMGEHLGHPWRKRKGAEARAAYFGCTIVAESGALLVVCANCKMQVSLVASQISMLDPKIREALASQHGKRFAVEIPLDDVPQLLGAHMPGLPAKGESSARDNE